MNFFILYQLSYQHLSLYQLFFKIKINKYHSTAPRDVTDAPNSPHNNKRLRSSDDFLNQADDSMSRIYQSQPMPNISNDESSYNETNYEIRNAFCFSQPTMMEDLILCTQLNSTQSTSQNQFQKLVKRMTRFFVSTNYDDTIKKLTTTTDKFSYTWKIHDGGMVS